MLAGAGLLLEPLLPMLAGPPLPSHHWQAIRSVHLQTPQSTFPSRPQEAKWRGSLPRRVELTTAEAGSATTSPKPAKTMSRAVMISRKVKNTQSSDLQNGLEPPASVLVLGNSRLRGFVSRAGFWGPELYKIRHEEIRKTDCEMDSLEARHGAYAAYTTARGSRQSPKRVFTIGSCPDWKAKNGILIALS